MLNLRTFGDNEFQTNWLIGFKMDFNYEIKIINKKHPKYKKIVKIINISVEHGIEQRVDDLSKHGIAILFYLFEKLLDSKKFNKIKYEMNKKRDQITFNEISNVFAFLLAAFTFLFVVFIIELIYYKFNNNLYWF